MTWFLYLLKTSRPGLWFPTIWLYLMPLANGDHWHSIEFWVGLLYVCFPLNFLIYGWNDLVDRETDRINPRKDSWLFGACGSDEELATLPRAIFLVQLFCWPVLIYYGGAWMFIALLSVVIFSWLYNHPTWGWRSRPPLDLLCQLGYLLTIPIATMLNQIPLPSLPIMGYLCLFCLQSQIIGEVMDCVPDRIAGRDTTATVLGIFHSKILLICVVLMEFLILGLHFQDWFFAGGLGVFALWLVIDLRWFKVAPYTPFQLKLFGVGSNAAALLSMVYVWWSGVFSGG